MRVEPSDDNINKKDNAKAKKVSKQPPSKLIAVALVFLTAYYWFLKLVFGL